MNRTQVESGGIKSIGYDPETETLAVEFRGGHVYHYRDVPASVHAELMQADSHGDYFHAKIKGTYDHEKA